MGKITEFINNNRQTFQLAYGIFLIISIPLLIALNTIFIVNKYNESLDATLQRQALATGRSVYSLLKKDLNNFEIIQQEIENLAIKNTDLEEVEVLVPLGDNFKIIASSNKNKVGNLLNFLYYQVAWTQPDQDGLATDSIRLATTPDGQSIVKSLPPDKRYWLVALPMKNADGEKTALLTLKLSSEIVDEMTVYNRRISLFILIITIFVAILFLSIAVRLWDYALLYKKIKEVDRMKDEFISMATHELRTPVTGIKGLVSMVLDGTLGEINKKLRNTMKMVEGASDRLSVLVEDLLNVSRIEQGRMKIELKPQDPGPIIKEIVKELKIQSDQKSLSLEYKPHQPKLPLADIDSDRFKQVLINIIGNAIKYTQKGGVKVITGQSGKFLEIKVKDTGVGMSAEEQERLFEKFYRAQNENTRKITGTGLGLWITKQIVELMKGKITVSSIENTGTQITIQFPIINSK